MSALNAWYVLWRLMFDNGQYIREVIPSHAHKGFTTTVLRYIVRQDEFAWLLLLLLLPPLLDSKFDSLRFPFSLALKLRALLTAN
jgi:hypothetical protein